MPRVLACAFAIGGVLLLTETRPAGSQFGEPANLAGAPLRSPGPADGALEWLAFMVTPTEPIFMKGYGSRTRPSEGVRQDLREGPRARATRRGRSPCW